MKKILMVLVVMSMVALVGCACPRADSNGVITKSATNCLLSAQDTICNATPEVKATANIGLNFLKPIVNSYLPGTTEYNAYITAENILSVGCATTTGLNELIAFLKLAQVQNQMMSKAGLMKASPSIDINSLIAWRDGK